jgi:hypothetical protein
MDTSEDQFQELLANVYARYKRSLLQGAQPPPMGLLLRGDGSIEVSIIAADSDAETERCLSAMREALALKAQNENIVAASMSHVDTAASRVVVHFENNENYCARVLVPLSVGSPQEMDMAALEVQDGSVELFSLI